MDTLTIETHGRVRYIGLNRAHKRNAFNLVMLHELAEALRDYERDRSVWCAVLFAHGEHFTAGLDLVDVGPAVASGGALFPENCPDPVGIGPIGRTKPLVMAVQGWCLTIGIELLLAADIRIAAAGTQFGQIEVKRGILPFGGATLRLPQIAGWGNAMRWILTGDTFDAAEAFRLGLVQEVVPDGQQRERAIALAERIAAQAPLAVQATIRCARIADEEGFHAGVQVLLPATRALMRTHDAAEGVQSFIERRDAKFTGT